MAFNEFFARRWRGEIALRTLFWRDMVVVGSAINLLASFLALMLAAQGVALGTSRGHALCAVPYNLFLFASIDRSPQRTATTTFLAGVWLVVATLV